MTAEVQNNQENKPNDKELNFRMLEAKYEKQLAQERAARIEAEKAVQNVKIKAEEDEDDDSEPYVDKKRLNKSLAKFGQQAKQETQSEIQKAVQTALVAERQQNWIKSNPDFYEVLAHADKLAQQDPELAESILEMPEGFERQKLVFKSIKALKLNQSALKTPSIQEKIDANKKSPFYQPTGVGSAPYSQSSDFSPAGQKQAYEKMKELKNRLRLG